MAKFNKMLATDFRDPEDRARAYETVLDLIMTDNIQSKFQGYTLQAGLRVLEELSDYLPGGNNFSPDKISEAITGITYGLASFSATMMAVAAPNNSPHQMMFVINLLRLIQSHIEPNPATTGTVQDYKQMMVLLEPLDKALEQHYKRTIEQYMAKYGDNMSPDFKEKLRNAYYAGDDGS